MAYDHLSIERRWQKYWEDHQTFKTVRRPGREKYYILDMFPYPSGHGLHVGHPEGYTATDIIARYKRMCGVDVLHPMGWDAFGLPAEQHAIATGTHPAETTRKNIDRFRTQLKSLGFAYDWGREVNTTELGYVKWTQWIFLRLFHRGLAFQAEIPVNWCPALGTVLANEEVVDGVSERGGHPVVRRPVRQWQLKITQYADRLAADLEGLDWPETKQKQRDWIGRSEGAEVEFPVAGRSEKITVYTTRPDTLFGATYLVVAPDHVLAASLATDASRDAVTRYIEQASHKSDMERTASKQKTGISTGSFAINPVNGTQIPIFIADYVLGAYGTGSIMAVPAHDTRDFEFATEFGLPIIQVVSADGKLQTEFDKAYTEPGIAVQSGEFDGLPSAEFKRRILDVLEARGVGRRKVNYKLRDWLFSRQRYWGEPIPIYFPVRTAGDPRQGAAYEVDYSRPIACEESELPLELPRLEDYHPGDPQGPLARALEWRFFQRDGQWFARETNTMPQWAGSCWYYLRYLDPHNPEQIFSQEAYDAWMPVDLYVGGSEHAVLHLLYARFWHKVLFDEQVVKHEEPFSKLVHQGMILGQTYRWYDVVDDAGVVIRSLDGDDPSVIAGAQKGTWVTKSGESVVAKFLNSGMDHVDGRPVHPENGRRLAILTEKMAKSRGNVVNPDDVVTESGADSLRVYEMFMGPLEQVKPWQTSGIYGVRRFLDKAEAVSSRPFAEQLDEETARLMHRMVKKVGEDIEAMKFNTAVSTLMMYTNHLNGLNHPPREAVEKLALCLAPFAPHLGEEMWERLGHAPSIAHAGWPQFDEAFCVDAVVDLPVQVNGKMRGKVTVAKDVSEEEAVRMAVDLATVQLALQGKTLRKAVFVPGKILNLIVG